MTSRTYSALLMYFLLTRGDALRSAQRLPLAIIFRAFGAAHTEASKSRSDFSEAKPRYW